MVGPTTKKTEVASRTPSAANAHQARRPSAARCGRFAAITVAIVMPPRDGVDDPMELGLERFALRALMADAPLNAAVWVSVDAGRTLARVPEQPAFEGINNAVGSLLEIPAGIVGV